MHHIRTRREKEKLKELAELGHSQDQYSGALSKEPWGLTRAYNFVRPRRRTRSDIAYKTAMPRKSGLGNL